MVTLPAWLLNIHTPMTSAMGTVMPMVKTPHGLLASALTTTMPSPASVTSRMNKHGDHRHQPGKRTDLGARNIGQRASAVAHGGHQHGEVLHAPGQHRANQQPEKSRSKAELRRQGRTHQRSRAGNGRKVMPEQNPLGRRHVVVAVLIGVGGSDAAVVQHHRLGGDERAVIPVRQGVHAKRAQHNRKRVHRSLCDPRSKRISQPDFAGKFLTENYRRDRDGPQ